jgi:hypothetical protein
MRILPARAGLLVLYSPTFAVAQPCRSGGIKLHMIFAEERMERLAAEERKPELVRDA